MKLTASNSKTILPSTPISQTESMSFGPHTFMYFRKKMNEVRERLDSLEKAALDKQNEQQTHLKAEEQRRLEEKKMMREVQQTQPQLTRGFATWVLAPRHAAQQYQGFHAAPKVTYAGLFLPPTIGFAEPQQPETATAPEEPEKHELAPQTVPKGRR